MRLSSRALLRACRWGGWSPAPAVWPPHARRTTCACHYWRERVTASTLPPTAGCSSASRVPLTVGRPSRTRRRTLSQAWATRCSPRHPRPSSSGLDRRCERLAWRPIISSVIILHPTGLCRWCSWRHCCGGTERPTPYWPASSFFSFLRRSCSRNSSSRFCLAARDCNSAHGSASGRAAAPRMSGARGSVSASAPLVTPLPAPVCAAALASAAAFAAAARTASPASSSLSSCPSSACSPSSWSSPPSDSESDGTPSPLSMRYSRVASSAAAKNESRTSNGSASNAFSSMYTSAFRRLHQPPSS
mmetsp:Transcript_5678/g.22407  ORF Transcript_5678/g.22407 Transcript_5678/m.22407 type:complete len:303 (+) Transcript_5678:3609-4517(+)